MPLSDAKGALFHVPVPLLPARASAHYVRCARKDRGAHDRRSIRTAFANGDRGRGRVLHNVAASLAVRALLCEIVDQVVGELGAACTSSNLLECKKIIEKRRLQGTRDGGRCAVRDPKCVGRVVQKASVHVNMKRAVRSSPLSRDASASEAAPPCGAALPRRDDHAGITFDSTTR